MDAKPCSACVYSSKKRTIDGIVSKFFNLTSQLCYFVNTATPSKSSLKQLKAIDEKFVKLPPQAYGSTELAILELGQFEDKKTLETCTVDKMYHRPTFTQRGSDGKFPVRLVDGSNADVINEVFDAPSTIQPFLHPSLDKPIFPFLRHRKMSALPVIYLFSIQVEC